MKFVYIANARIPTEKAHGIQIMKMCESFAGTDGVSVDLVVPNRRNEIKEDSLAFYNIKSDFKIDKIPCIDLFFDSGFFGKVSFFIETISFLVSAKLKLAFSDFDVLYTREPFAGLFFKNFILEMHSLPKKKSITRLWIWSRAKKLVVLTNLMKNRLMELGMPENKILVAPDAVDLQEFGINISKEESRAILNLPVEKKIILYSGSFFLYDWKGVDVLLKAAESFSEEHLFVFVGGAEKDIEKIKGSWNSKNIFLVGHTRHNLIPLYLKAADVLVLPNKKGDMMSEEYTSPLKLFEYMAAKRPIVASNLPAMAEILNEGNAVLVAPNDPVALANGIVRIMNDFELAEKIRMKAFADAQNHTWKNRSESILNFIKE